MKKLFLDFLCLIGFHNVPDAVEVKSDKEIPVKQCTHCEEWVEFGDQIYL